MGTSIGTGSTVVGPLSSTPLGNVPLPSEPLGPELPLPGDDVSIEPGPLTLGAPIEPWPPETPDWPIGPVVFAGPDEPREPSPEFCEPLCSMLLGPLDESEPDCPEPK